MFTVKLGGDHKNSGQVLIFLSQYLAINGFYLDVTFSLLFQEC